MKAYINLKKQNSPHLVPKIGKFHLFRKFMSQITNFLIDSLHIYKAKSFPDFCMFLGYILFDILIFIYHQKFILRVSYND